MAKIAIHNLEGKKIEEMEVSESVFGVKSNNELLRQVYMVLAGNKRSAIAHTKTKGDRAGSGKKPFRQKGTGSARQGQKRNPVMRGGGIAFGPTNERNFKRDLNKKMKQKAVMIALSEKLRSATILAVAGFAEEKKTKKYADVFKKLQIKGSVLVAFDEKEKKTSLYTRNLSNAQNIMTKDLNAYDLLNNKYLLISKESIAFLENKFQVK